MRYWLFKSEPNEWSWSDQVAKGAAGEEWSGVRNYQARNFMRAMQLGDLGFFYHSQSEKAVVGIVEVSALAHQDSTAVDPKWECVDITARVPLERPVSLAEIKARVELAQMALVKNPRLSVQPVTKEQWQNILTLGGMAADEIVSSTK